MEPSSTVYESVLQKAGAFPRDVVDQQIVSEFQTRTGQWGARRPSNLMEGLTPTTPPADLDNDGMADVWEVAHGLNPSDGNDHSTVFPSGYTAIEEYINCLAEQLIGGPDCLR
jgi:pectate lyase